MKTINGFQVEVNRGPNWLFLTLAPDDSANEATHLADELWAAVAPHFVYRVVVEFVDLDSLSKTAARQIDEFRQRLEAHGGALRVCGLSPKCAELLQSQCAESNTRSRLQSHSSLAAAVLGPDHAQDGPPPAHHSSRSPEVAKQGTAYESLQVH